MVNADKRDIHIGENEWISWKEIETSNNAPFEIDYIIKGYDDFWNLLELYCVADCCGLDAFRFYPTDIANAANTVDSKLLKQDLIKLRLTLFESDKIIVISKRLNNLADKSVFIQLLDHIIHNLS